MIAPDGPCQYLSVPDPLGPYLDRLFPSREYLEEWESGLEVERRDGLGDQEKKRFDRLHVFLEGWWMGRGYLRGFVGHQRSSW
jgi:hypothetical protein